MARGTPALIRPSLLIWARERAGLRLEEAAERAGIEVEHLRLWEEDEEGKDHPSIPQLRKLGIVYNRPLAVFFLPEPPKGFDPQREFRRLAGVSPRSESPELRLALRLAIFRREAARELYERLNEAVPDLKVSVHPHENEEAVGRRIRDSLGISWQEQVNWPSPYAALNGWREAVERLGILVFQTGGVDFNEMRGTSIPSGPLPVILLNNADAPHGRIFTLLHELAHILLAQGGHRTSLMEGRRLPEDQLLERSSNRFAAAALMPRSEFLDELRRYPDAKQGDENDLRLFANRIKVSPEAILRRLVTLNQASAKLYEEKRESWKSRPWFRAPQGGAVPIETRVISSTGRSFASLVLEGYQRNAISSSDVVDYLGLQLKYIERVADQLAVGPAAGPLG